MDKQRAIAAIREGLELAKTAPVEKKIQILKMVKECYRRLNQSQSKTQSVQQTQSADADYLDEK